MAFAGKSFLLKMEDPDNLGTYIAIGGARSCSLSVSGATQSTSEFIGQASELAIPGTKQTTTTVSASGVFVDSDAEQAVFDLKFSGASWRFRLCFASYKELTGYFQVTAFSRTGDMSAAEGYSLSLQGDNISYADILDVTPPSGASWDSANMAPNGQLTDGDLVFETTSSASGGVIATVGVSSGAKYWEVTYAGVSGGYSETDRIFIGITWDSSVAAAIIAESPSPDGCIIANYGGFGDSPLILCAADSYSQGNMNNGFVDGDVVGIAVDYAAKTFTMYKNGSMFLSPTDLTAGDNESDVLTTVLTETWWPFVHTGKSGAVFTLASTSAELTYSPPMGYDALGD